MMRTICQKLEVHPSASADDTVGGSTYTFVVWPGHPLEQRVLQSLARFREAQSELRRQVDAHNEAAGIPPQHVKIVSYAGQCMLEREGEESRS
jgi:hypothetical protein